MQRPRPCSYPVPYPGLCLLYTSGRPKLQVDLIRIVDGILGQGFPNKGRQIAAHLIAEGELSIGKRPRAGKARGNVDVYKRQGLTQGSPKSIPAYNTDYIFAVICEEFGIIFGIAVIALYLVFIIRGALVALYARDRYLMLVAFGCTVLITLQSFIIIGGVIKLIPLTGITMPFVSHGGSSLIASLMLLGLSLIHIFPPCRCGGVYRGG